MLLPGRATERLSCVREGVRPGSDQGAPEVWVSFKGLQGFLEQSRACGGGGLRQQAAQLVRQSKQEECVCCFRT